MLILSRKQDDSIVIGDEIEIKVISIDKGSVRLGFSAPDHLVILRGELKEAVALQNKQASCRVDIEKEVYPKFQSFLKTRK